MMIYELRISARSWGSFTDFIRKQYPSTSKIASDRRILSTSDFQQPLSLTVFLFDLSLDGAFLVLVEMLCATECFHPIDRRHFNRKHCLVAFYSSFLFTLPVEDRLRTVLY
ncbi:hypothetical protein X798_01136 [Onchocerca flexuosa]|uniref:Ovule protein n=2 Tax=Onchocerca flexuosa TaxID=387005 RepID=A0A183I2E5_9BILA|nr:hypothetical protein X798_01136 [Onchocerca flexuosa]VDP14962.1 unnamed protein product [Onchocerca flexuosa]